MANRNINIRFDASMDISKIKNSVAEMQRSLSNVKFSQVNEKKFIKYFQDLNNSIENFKLKADKEITSTADFNKLYESANKVADAYNNIFREVSAINKLGDIEFLKAFSSDSIEQINRANKALENFSKTKNNKNKINTKKSQIEIETEKYEKAQKELDNLKKKTVLKDEEYDKLKSRRSQAITKKNQALKNLTSFEDANGPQGTKQITSKGNVDKRKKNWEITLKTYNQLLEAAKKANEEYEKLNETFKKSTSEQTYNSELKEKEQSVANFTQKIEKLNKELNELESEDTNKFEQLKKTLSELTGKDFSNFQNTAEDIEKIKEELNKIKSDEIIQLRQNFEQLENSSEEAGDSIQNAKGALNEFGQSVIEVERTAQEIDQLKNSMLAFFSISNTIEIFKRTIREAYQTVTELDKAMTETAVVTDFSVGDMWEALPRYTEAANKLGTTTLGAYETMTLFYQQGLKTNEVFEIGTETMKMARIAGMDYTKATDLMTAALRGFNMELNEVSAQRINDVYSELAAITAADTEEIADAMTRTASIANSAGMEFETTSAFLSQMINFATYARVA